MPTTRFTLDESWVLVGQGPCTLQCIGVYGVRLHFGSSAPAQDALDYDTLYAHGGNNTALRDYTGSEDIYARAHQERLDGTVYESLLSATGANLGIVAPPPGQPLKTPTGSKTLAAGQSATIADLEALVPSGKITSVTFVVAPNSSGLGGMTIIGTYGTPTYFPAPSSATYSVDELARNQLGAVTVTCDNIAGASVNILFTGTAA
jgi:hypothetical protein